MSYSSRKHTRRSPATSWTALLALAALLVIGAAPVAADYDDYRGDDGYDGYGDTAGYESSYSYVRTLEGSATLIQGDTQDRDALQVNQPVLVGDRIWVAPSGRVEVVLSDGNRLRIDGGSEVDLRGPGLVPGPSGSVHHPAAAPGQPAARGRPGLPGRRLPAGRHRQRHLLRQRPGQLPDHRRRVGGPRWSPATAPAEVVTPEGSVPPALRRGGGGRGERAGPAPRCAGRAARTPWRPGASAWTGRAAPYSQYVDSSIGYESARLDRYGAWDRYEGRYGWRPRVAVDWRPYHNGRWSFSPLGLNWVSYEPWGWAPYHYGTWDYVGGYGWVWFPGHRFSPAWVYWNWTDRYAGWVPVGFYSRYYWSSYGRYGLRAGVYGYAHAGWGHYGYWNFCDTRYLGDRHQYRHVDRGDRFGQRNRYAVPKRGIVTTDTRGITRTAVRRAEGIEDALAERVRRRGGRLEDVTPFVERRKELPDDVRGRVLADRADRLDRGTPSRAARIEGGEARRPTRLLAEDAVPGAGARTPNRAVRKPGARPDVGRGAERGVERRAPVLSSKPGVARPDGARSATPSRTDRSARPTPSARTDRGTPSRDWRDRSAAPAARGPEGTRATPSRAPDRGTTTRPPARTPSRSQGIERRDDSSSRPEARRPPAARESGSERGEITRRVIEGVRSNERRANPSRSTETKRSSPPPSSRPSARSSAPSRAPRASSPRRAPTRSRSTSPPPRSSTRSKAGSSSRGRPSARPDTRSSSRPSTRPSARSNSRPSSRPSARPAPRRSSKPPVTTRSKSRPSGSKARSSSPPSRSSSKARSSSRGSSRPSARSAPSRSSSRSRATSRRAPSRSSSKARARRGKPPV